MSAITELPQPMAKRRKTITEEDFEAGVPPTPPPTPVVTVAKPPTPGSTPAPIVHMMRNSSISEFKPENVELIESDSKGTLEYKMYFEYEGHRISPWHDIPLYANKEKTAVNFICEIPKGTAAKFEISRTIPGNPIIQDRKTNKETGLVEPRSYQWPEEEPQMFWNYGALPQTWEKPDHEEKDISIGGEHPKGDNDPIDAIMLGEKSLDTGDVCAVKVLGVLALVDDGETDWKLLVVDVADATFENISTLKELLEVPEHKAEVQKMSDWLRDYKTISKGQTNHVHWDGEPRCEKYAMSKVSQTHDFWRENTNSGAKNRELDN